MRKQLQDFNIKRFLTIVIPFGLVAILMVLSKPKDTKKPANNPYPVYNLHLEAKSAAGSIILNDISIGHHESGRELIKSTIALTPWLLNGTNTLYLSTRQVHADAQPLLKASLEVIPINGVPETKPLFDLTKPAAEGVRIDAANLPQWSWQRGAETFHDLTELRQAVKKLHTAFANKNVTEIRAIEAPMFTDMVKVTGRDGLERRQYRDEIIQRGQLDPLQKLIIVPFANGKVMRVTQPDGEAPIRIFFRYGNGGKVILTGKFWSKIEGEWRVVR